MNQKIRQLKNLRCHYRWRRLLTLASLLKNRHPIGILERRDRAYIEMRRRGERAVVRMFKQWGLANRLLSGLVAQTIEYRLIAKRQLH